MFRSLAAGDLGSHSEGGHIINCEATQFIYPKCDKSTQITCLLATETASSWIMCIPNFWATRSRHIFLKPQKCFLFHPKFYPPAPFRKRADASTEVCYRKQAQREVGFRSPLSIACLPPARPLPIASGVGTAQSRWQQSSRSVLWRFKVRLKQMLRVAQRDRKIYQYLSMGHTILKQGDVM